jgi:osmotically inducible protein OsmC
MPTRTGHAVWRGDLKSGTGRLDVESGTFEAAYSYPSRFESGSGTNPEELIGAAHAGCFSMALANLMAQDGHVATRVETTARVALSTEGGAHIAGIELHCEAEVPGLDPAAFQDYAEKAKAGCPVSKALAVDVTLQATLH